MATFYNTTEHGRVITKGALAGDGSLPKLSTKLDSIRPYQFEVEFVLPGGVAGSPQPQLFTVAAKQVSEIGYTVEDIEVHRVNDRYYYPGKATPEEVTITFDNLKANPLGGNTMAMEALYSWCQKTYDPLTGQFGDIDQGLKTNMKIHQLDEDLSPFASITLYGSYPKSYKRSIRGFITNYFKFSNTSSV